MVKLVWEIPPLQAISEPEAQIQKHKYSLEETDYKQRDHHRLIVALSLLDEGLVAHIEHHKPSSVFVFACLSFLL